MRARKWEMVETLIVDETPANFVADCDWALYNQPTVDELAEQLDAADEADIAFDNL